MRNLEGLRGRAVAAALFLVAAFAVAAQAFDRDGLEVINRNYAALMSALEADPSGGVDAPLNAAYQLLNHGEHRPATSDSAASVRGTPDMETEDPARQGAVGKALLAPLLQKVALETGSMGHRELMEASAPSGGEVLIVKSGALTLGSLPAALQSRGWSDLLTGADGKYLLKMPLVILEDGVFVIEPGDELEMATDRGAFILNFGSLAITDALVKGSAAQPRLPDFHPFIQTARGGRAAITGSRFTGLGFDARPLMSGLSFASSPFATQKSRGVVHDNVFDDVRSVEVTGIDDFEFVRNRIQHARGIGLRLEQLKGGTIRDNVIVASGMHGILAIGSTGLDIDGNIAAENGGRGFFGRDGIGHLTVSDNVLVANREEGISIAGGSCVDIRGNAVLRNRQDGITIAQSLGIRLAGNLLVRNQGSGISINDSISPADSVEVSQNRFVANNVGLSAERFATIRLSGNNFSDQLPVLFGDALQYETPRYLGWARSNGEKPDAVFEISSARGGSPLIFQGDSTGMFRLSDMTGCHFKELD
ncbi:right-handed parallel beta-helix repeat-containing protein [Martelella radicis]|uniref:Poly(Beta-D-mannuronate) C5 epimerase n=1 Tax=Martelella radicis TaxID=1397476 RepID=A0A7W6KHQ8_9HYPH|nr:right-handed parallel beta-helix repeat-containing protein [Martelella radicis]MBB4121416.1 poly(beta-D-mannuronate) C5 epimerase [Martelella radicis]